MKLTAQIDSSCKSMENYFNKLFAVYYDATKEESQTPLEVQDLDSELSQAQYHGFSHLIKPGMVIDSYSLLEFWLIKLCDTYKNLHNLSLPWWDAKGRDDLKCMHNYLIQHAGINLDAVKNNYTCINQLRIVRNVLVHSGGHVKQSLEPKFKHIQGVSLCLSYIVVKDEFVYSSLDNVRTYLLAAAQPLST